jgi:hypothetical protein
MKTRSARFIRLYFEEDAVEVHIIRVGSTKRYKLHRGEPSLDRMGRLLAGRKYTSYGGQKGWGVTPDNGRPHHVYLFRTDWDKPEPPCLL